MRYILNNEGYIYDVSFGAEIECSLGICTEYKGEVPDGYETIEEWHDKEIDRLNAWKIVDGNLVFDENRDYKLKILFDQQNNENSHVTRKEMGMSSTEEINPYTDLFPSHETSGGYIVGATEKYGKVGNLPTEEVKLSLLKEQDLDFIELEFIGDNFLPNTAISSVNNGIEYTQNKDKTINVSGIATNKSTLNLAGTDTSVRNILTFKADEDYLLFGLEGLSLEFYHYDGSDRTLVGVSKDGVISFDKDTNITQVVLVVDKGTSINTTIKPMLKLVGLEYPVMPMKKYKGNLFDENTLSNYSNYTKTLNSNYKGYEQQLKPNTIYTIKVFNNGWVGNGGWIYRIYNSANTLLGTLQTLNLDDDVVITFTTDNTGIVYFATLYGNQDRLTSWFNSVDILLVEGSVATEYEAYNGKDGRYYVDGISTQATRSGKNTLKGLSTSLTNTEYWLDVNKYYFTPLEEGWGKFNYDNTNGTSTVFINAKVKLSAVELKENTTYTIVTEIRNSSISENAGAFFQLLTNNTAVAFQTSRSLGYSNINQGGIFKSTSITKESFDGIECAIDTYLRLSAGTKGTVEARISLIEGEIDTTNFVYEAYGVSPSPDYPSEIINIYKAGTYNAIANNKIYTFILPEDLRSVPTYNNIADRLWIDVDGDNGINIERKVGEVVLDGSDDELWSVYASYNNDGGIGQCYQIQDASFGLGVSTSICSHFKNVTSSFMHNIGYVGSYCDHATVHRKYFISDKATIEEWKTWLSTHNVEINYALATTTTSYIPSFNYDEYEYEEYKNNTTLIDLAGNKLTIPDEISIKDNQIILVKNNGEEIYLGDTVMPRTYTPYTHAYCHQNVFIGFKYKDPRNVDITKINLKGLISITDVETEYNFCDEDLTRIRNYLMDTGDLTDEEIELYDINGDGRISSSDYVLIRNMINGISSNKIEGTFEINTTQSKRVLVLRDSEGKILTSLGLNGIFTPSLSVNGGKVYGEHVLFSGETNGDVALSDDVRNYDYIEIYYKSNGNAHSSVRIYQADDKQVPLNIEHIYTSGNLIYKETLLKTILINNSSITNVDYGYFQTMEKEINNVNMTGNYIYITRVVGYKGNKSEITEEDEPDTPVTPEEPTEDVIEVNKTSIITGSTSDNARWTFKTEATEVSIDKVNKTSTVTVTNYIGRPSTNTSSHFMGNLTINYTCGSQSESETVYKNSGTINSGGWYKLGSRTFTIEHTEEPMIINVSGSMSTSEFNPSSASAKGSITLTRI